MAGFETATEAGVYRIVNTVTGRCLLGRSENLRSVRSKLEFAVSSNSPNALDHRLQPDVRTHGLAPFEFEVLDTLSITAQTTRDQIRADLDALLELWRDRQDPGTSY